MSNGDEFAIFVSDAADYEIARSIMKDINGSMAKTAVKQNMPAITLSAGAVIAKHGDNYTALYRHVFPSSSKIIILPVIEVA